MSKISINLIVSHFCFWASIEASRSYPRQEPIMTGIQTQFLMNASPALYHSYPLPHAEWYDQINKGESLVA